MFCQNCGTTLEEGTVFCGNCGAKQGAANESSGTPANRNFSTMENPFFKFIQPYLSYIDNGHLFRKPFSWLYVLFAILNLISPLYVFYIAADNHIFDSPGKYIFVFLLVWAVIAFAGWISFQLFWDRGSKINTSSFAGDDFVATPVFSHFIQTLGEWLGTWIGIVGFAIALLTTIILGEEGNYFSRSLGLPGFLGGGVLAIFMMPVLGFLIILITRFFAEQARALSSIANNTQKGLNQPVNGLNE